MRTPGNKCLALVFVVLLSIPTTYCKILSGNPFKKLTVLKQDNIFIPLEKSFDLEHMTYPLTATSTKGRVLTYNQPFRTNTYPQKNIKTVNMVKSLTPWVIAIVFNDNQLVIQRLTADRKDFKDSHQYDLSHPKSEITCSDALYNKIRSLIYVSCFPKNSQGQDNLVVHTIDYGLKQTISSLNIPQDDGFRIQNRLKMFISVKQDVRNESIQSMFLFLYDQGRSDQKESKGNHQVRILRNVEYGSLKNYKLLQLKGNPDLKVVYDFLPYKGSIIISIRTTQTPYVISLMQCYLNQTYTCLECINQIKETGVIEGFVTINNDSSYIAVNTQIDTIAISKLQGQFSDHQWSHQIIGTHQIPSQGASWIKEIFNNHKNAVINWNLEGKIQPTSTYLSWGLKKSWSNIGESSVSLGDVFFTLILKNDSDDHDRSMEFNLIWPRPPYFYFPTHELTLGDHFIKVTLQDQSNQKSKILNLRVINDTFELLNIDLSSNILILKSGETLEYPMKPSHILDGNAVEAEVSIDNPGILKAQSYSFKKLEVKWNPNLSN